MDLLFQYGVVLHFMSYFMLVYHLSNFSLCLRRVKAAINQLVTDLIGYIGNLISFEWEDISTAKHRYEFEQAYTCEHFFWQFLVVVFSTSISSMECFESSKLKVELVCRFISVEDWKNLQVWMIF